MTRTSALRVLIVGGGIGGLALAHALQRGGIESEIVEVTKQWSPVGAGIVLGVNAMKIMTNLGLADRLEARSHLLREMAICDAQDRVLGSTNLASLQSTHGKSLAMHRAVLHEVLLESVEHLKIRLGTTVDAIDQASEGVSVRFSDKTNADFDLVVGADGLNSTVRELVFGKIPLSYSGYTCWRFVVERPKNVVRGSEMWGRGLRFGIVPVDDTRVYCFAVANARAGTPDPEEGRVERFHERFSVFGGPVPEIIAQVKRPDQLIHNDLNELIHREWYRSRVVLIGDAAHAMTPNMGQGAAMALEDAAVLAEVMTKGGSEESSDPVAAGLAAWFERRRRRVTWVQNQSRRIGRVAQWQNPLLCGVRNAIARMTPDRVTEAGLIKLAEQEI